MGTNSWDPEQYDLYQEWRARPFRDLVNRIPDRSPAQVVDLGCGPGNLTAELAARWPEAAVTGVDSSPAMIGAAREHEVAARLNFVLGDLRDWEWPSRTDVVVCNVALQWVPDHEELLPRLVEQLSSGGTFAFQVPGQAHLAAPCYEILYETARSGPWRENVSAVLENRPSVLGAIEYIDLLASSCESVEAWETEYFYILNGPDPVLEWMLGTAARPVVEAVPEEYRPEFVKIYSEGLREAYPERSYGTLFPQHRFSAVASR